MAGEPTYLELGTPDADRARAFYGPLLGWPPDAFQVSTPTLDIGIHGADPKAQFEVFFAVDDLAASLEIVRARGGQTTSDVNDDEGFGRWVECEDDQGVRFGLRQRT